VHHLWLCHAECDHYQRLNFNIEKLFCEYCGSHALIKVSVYINHNREITFFKNPRRKARLRGTKYTLPKPKGGRMGDGLILREDELMVGHKRIMVRQIAREKIVEQTAINDNFQGNYWAGGEN